MVYYIVMYKNSDVLLNWLDMIFTSLDYETNEHTLIKQAVLAGLLPSGFNDNSLILFHTHFVLFNALYQFNDQLHEKFLRLEINTLKIALIPITAAADGQAIVDEDKSALRAYYLDWSNLEAATDESVESLLDSFWQCFADGPVTLSDKQAALKVMGLDEAIPADFKLIKQAYRRLVMIEHPDRGGNKVRLQNINDAMATLVRAYGKR